jgi:hydroxymethylbilane synthase
VIFPAHQAGKLPARNAASGFRPQYASTMDPSAPEIAAPATLGTVVIGARGSKLAQVMVAEFRAGLGGSCPVVRFENRVVATDGDRDRRSPLSVVGGAGGGAFTSQLEAELLERRIDVAVHSLKDLPTQLPAGLALATTPGPRGDLRDALVGASLRTSPASRGAG